jgi:putative transferase (TIGR04331 family)
VKDWTETYNQHTVAEKSNRIVDCIISTIYKNKLCIYEKHNFTSFEVDILLRWVLYVGVNTYIERLLRVKANQNINYYPDISDVRAVNPRYYKDTVESVQAYYYDYTINYNLLSQLAGIINRDTSCTVSNDSNFSSQHNIVNEIENKAGNKLKKYVKKYILFVEKIFYFIFKPKIIGDTSAWFRNLYMFGHSVDFNKIKFSTKKIIVDSTARNTIKEVCYQSFKDNINGIVDVLDGNQVDQLAVIFSEWIDHIIPVSIVEELDDRFIYYTKLVRKWHIEQLHSFTGYYYSDNLKIFAIIVRRHGAKLVGHSHGVSNYTSFYKGSNELKYLDYYTTYGKCVTDSLLNNPEAKNVKFLPVGSVSLYKLKKWKKTNDNNSIITLFYPSGPMRYFMSDLQEISPEKRMRHRLDILSFLNSLFMNYPKLNILYKPFPGTFSHDPIRTKLSQWFDKGKIKLYDDAPYKIYADVDVVLWDSISTGFAESMNAQVPTIVFNCKSEYDLSSPDGKIVNDALTEVGVQCFNAEDAMKSFKRIKDDPQGYKNDSTKVFKKFKEDSAMPVSKKTWHKHYNDQMSKYVND